MRSLGIVLNTVVAFFALSSAAQAQVQIAKPVLDVLMKYDVKFVIESYTNEIVFKKAIRGFDSSGITYNVFFESGPWACYRVKVAESEINGSLRLVASGLLRDLSCDEKN